MTDQQNQVLNLQLCENWINKTKRSQVALHLPKLGSTGQYFAIEYE